MSKIVSAVAFCGIFVVGFLASELLHAGDGSGPRLGVKQPDQTPQEPEEGVYCIANRADNNLHIGLALTAACGAFSSRTPYTHEQLNCDKWGSGKCTKPDGSPPDEDSDEGPWCPPPECQDSMSKADWVFSTYYNLVGHCEQYHGAKTNAATTATLSNYTYINPKTPKKECLLGWGRGKGYAALEAKGKSAGAMGWVIAILLLIILGLLVGGAYYYWVKVKGNKLDFAEIKAKMTGSGASAQPSA